MTSPKTCKRIAIVVALSLASLLHPSIAVSQSGIPILTRNDSFEGSDGNGAIAGWNYRAGLRATVLESSAPSSARSEERAFGAHMVRLRGTGGFGQTIRLRPSTGHVLLNFAAYAQYIDSQKDANAFVTVAIYDEDWNEIDAIEVPFGPKRADVENGWVTGLGRYTWGIDLPLDAKYALLAVWNWDENVEILIDNFLLAEYTPHAIDVAKGKSIVSRNLLVNDFPGGDSSGYSTFRLWSEFWQSSIDYSAHPYSIQGTWGSPNQDEWAYQIVPMRPGKAYQFKASARTGYQTQLPEVGIDFYDSNWNPIGKQVLDATGIFPPPPTEVLPPPRTAYGSVYFYVPRGTYSPAPTFSLRDLGPRAGAPTTITVNDVGLVRPRYSPIRGTQVILTIYDADGIDRSSITADAFFATSYSAPSENLPVIFYSNSVSIPPAVSSYNEDRTVEVYVYAQGAVEQDVSSFVVKPGWIKDKLGNAYSGKTFSIDFMP